MFPSVRKSKWCTLSIKALPLTLLPGQGCSQHLDLLDSHSVEIRTSPPPNLSLSPLICGRSGLLWTFPGICTLAWASPGWLMSYSSRESCPLARWSTSLPPYPMSTSSSWCASSQTAKLQGDFFFILIREGVKNCFLMDFVLNYGKWGSRVLNFW